MSWLQVLIAVVAGLALLWLALLVVLRIAARDQVRMKDALRLLPDLLRLIGSLIKDPTLPRRVRWMLIGLAAYLALPIDLVPDFLPVVGYADDALLTALVLRFTVRAAGQEAITRHWAGTAQGLDAVLKLAGINNGSPNNP